MSDTRERRMLWVSSEGRVRETEGLSCEGGVWYFPELGFTDVAYETREQAVLQAMHWLDLQERLIQSKRERLKCL